MTEPTSTDAVRIERIVAAPIAVVWQMWTDPIHFAAWYGPGGATVIVEEMDLGVGGRRHVFESEMKEERRSRGRRHHEGRPPPGS